MSNESMTAPSATPETMICSNCLHEIHRSDPKRYVGAYVTHSHERCIELLRLSVIDLERRMREAQEESSRTIGLLQQALYRWLPGVRNSEMPVDVQAWNDALLLFGMKPDDHGPEYGEQLYTRALAAEQKAERMREALRNVVERRDAHGYTSVNKRADDMAAIARAALGSEE